MEQKFIELDTAVDAETLEDQRVISKMREYEKIEKEAKRLKEHFKSELMRRAETRDNSIDTEMYSVTLKHIKSTRLDTQWAKDYFKENLIEPKMIESESKRVKVDFKLDEVSKK